MWDELEDGHPCQEIRWAERLRRSGAPPPPWMRPVGRREAEHAASTVRWLLLMVAVAVVAAGVCVWSLE